MNFGEAIAGLVGVGLLGLFIWGAVLEESNWQAFKEDHHCKLVRTTESRTITTISSKGEVGFGTVHGQDCWLCDDGVERCR